MSPGSPATNVFSLRIAERTMPTGSKDPDVLLEWLMDSMCLVRRRSDQGTDGFGALHRIMREALLEDPLRGWSSKELGDQTGLSNTGVHHQMLKLRECGLVASKLDGKWHRYVLRGGSISSAIQLVQSEARAVLGLRMSELAGFVEPSETRMEIAPEEPEIPFSISIMENGPKDSLGESARLVSDLGLAGEGRRVGDSLAEKIFIELTTSHHPITYLALSERLSSSRGRVKTVVDRMRSAGIVERAPMLDRIPQDVYSGLVRQHDARGEEWLLTKGGLGRLDQAVSDALISGVRKQSMDIEGVARILSSVSVEDQRTLLNTLGGRMPFGLRVAGEDGSVVAKRVMNLADRAIRRIGTVAGRLDESI